MSFGQSQWGVSGMALYVPTLCVELEDWCEWTGNPWRKIHSVVGRSFRMPDHQENIYTMAANAVLRLILQNDIDPREVGFLGFGTESSSDNATGTVILKGMVNQALEAMDMPRLSRHCEVPEFKQACLGGVYALKAAVRWLAFDGQGKKAIVVCGDKAEYERGSSGEATQGAGAIAMLVEEDPKLFSLELRNGGNASDYRGFDFRKPFQRHFMEGYAIQSRRMHDFPVFSGKYSMICYIEETIQALDDMLSKIGMAPRPFYHKVDGLFLHRPYHRMPVNAAAALYIWGLSRNEDHRGELREYCDAAGVNYDLVLAEMLGEHNLFQSVLNGNKNGNIFPESMQVVRFFRNTPKFKEVVQNKMSLGADLMMDLGNLYTASLFSWMAAGFTDALEQDIELYHKEFVIVGYGSGDAAEAIPIRVMPTWREAAQRIQFRDALASKVVLNQEQYESLHDEYQSPELDYERRGRFEIDRVGNEMGADFQDVGVEYYEFNH